MSKVNYWLELQQSNATDGITLQLSQQINLLGILLGEAITENTSVEMLALVELLRNHSKQAEQQQDFRLLQQLAQELQHLPLEDINWLLRIYVLFFTLVNEAEIQEIIRINQERNLAATLENPPIKNSL
jgi:phosphoenolpyruvate carboxylase